MTENDGNLCIRMKKGGNVWTDSMKRIMNEDNDWDHNVEEDAVEGAVNCINRDEMVQVLNKMKTGITPGPSAVSLELITASWKVEIK